MRMAQNYSSYLIRRIYWSTPFQADPYLASPKPKSGPTLLIFLLYTSPPKNSCDLHLFLHCRLSPQAGKFQGVARMNFEPEKGLRSRGPPFSHACKLHMKRGRDVSKSSSTYLSHFLSPATVPHDPSCSHFRVQSLPSLVLPNCSSFISVSDCIQDDVHFNSVRFNLQLYFHHHFITSAYRAIPQVVASTLRIYYC